MVPFVGPSHPLPLDRADLQRAINLHPVRAEDPGEKTEAQLRQVPGLTLWSEEPAPPAAAPVIGWMTDILDSGSAPLYANTGSGHYAFGLDPVINPSMFAGVVGYTSGTVVWTPTWAPAGSDPAPTLTPLSGGRLQVDWPNLGGFPPFTSEGLLTLTATVDGGPSAATIEASVSLAFYATIAWQPTP